MAARLLFKDGTKRSELLTEPAGLIADMEAAREALYTLPVDALLEYFDALSRFWLSRTDILSIHPNVRALAAFVARKNLEHTVTVALRGSTQVLDSFSSLPGDTSSMRFRCQPRGLSVHWLAGNAPLLGFYSLIQALITKNVAIIKASSRAHEEFVDILLSLTEVNTSSVSGAQLLKAVAVILIDRDDRIWQHALSEAADIRIAWGGKEAIESISMLPKASHAEDIMLGPKYSFGIIDKESMVEYAAIAKKLALDIATFDQYACSSPHTVFVETGGAASVETFAQAVAEALDFVGKKMIRKASPDPKKNMDILTLRATYTMRGKVWASTDTEWTVILSEEPGLAPACASRVVFVRPVSSLTDVASFVGRGTQTVGIALTGKNTELLLSRLTARGVDRCVPYGRMTFFESPWDGMFMIDRLVRWVSFYQ